MTSLTTVSPGTSTSLITSFSTTTVSPGTSTVLTTSFSTTTSPAGAGAAAVGPSALRSVSTVGSKSDPTSLATTSLSTSATSSTAAADAAHRVTVTSRGRSGARSGGVEKTNEREVWTSGISPKTDTVHLSDSSSSRQASHVARCSSTRARSASVTSPSM